MGITLDRVTGNYEVLDLILQHNHVLHLPQTSQYFSSFLTVHLPLQGRTEFSDPAIQDLFLDL